jgi:hypothetical protein
MRPQLLLAIILTLCIGAGSICHAATLQRAYELAGPASGYDKYLELETGRIYTGGLFIGPSLIPYSTRLAGGAGLDVRIVGNGAILDLEGQQLCISYCNNKLDIDDCIVVNGDIRFRGLTFGEDNYIPTGSVRLVTFYAPHDYGVRLQHVGTGILVERNLVVNAVDTGLDFIYTNGISMEFLPTGTNISASWTAGNATIRENWSYHTDPKTNGDPLAHFSFL